MHHKNYHYKDLDMLMTSQVIAESFQSNLSALSTVYPEFTRQYANSLSEKINKGFEYFLGLGTTKELQRIKNTLNSVQTQSLRAIAFLKTLIEIRTGNDAKRKKQILETLGFRKYLKAVRNNDTMALLGLLSSIHDKMDDSLKEELIKNKSDAAFIERISEYAKKLNRINRSKESLNATRKAIEEEAQQIFNTIYSDIINICKIAARFFKDDQQKHELFVFSKVANHIKSPVPVS